MSCGSSYSNNGNTIQEHNSIQGCKLSAKDQSGQPKLVINPHTKNAQDYLKSVHLSSTLV